jgi:hypothetical protein
VVDERIARQPLAQVNCGKFGDMPTSPTSDRYCLPDAQIDDPSDVERDHAR